MSCVSPLQQLQAGTLPTAETLCYWFTILTAQLLFVQLPNL